VSIVGGIAQFDLLVQNCIVELYASENAQREMNVQQQEKRHASWRAAPWLVAAALFLLPLVAMQFSDGVSWDETDFMVFAAMLVGACGAYEWAARMTGNVAYRAAVGVAVVAAFLLIWINLAVGIIGSEDNPANLMYAGVLVVVISGGLVARFQPRGMAWTLAATAVAQTWAGAIALLAGLGSTGANWPRPIVVLTVFFAAAWLVSAWLFRKAAIGESSSGAAAPMRRF
jgi:hypothetical protein